MSIANPIFRDEAKATAHIEAQRWGGEPDCPPGVGDVFPDEVLGFVIVNSTLRIRFGIVKPEQRIRPVKGAV